jgi:Protein of unknown function (DUF3341)
MYLDAEFQERDAIIRALRNLKESGVRSDDLDVFSDVPLELPRDALKRPSHMSFAVLTGAITFLLLAIGFVWFTQNNYRIITGGMPLFSFWATGVVFYELMMLGAIATSLLAFLYESGLLRRVRRPPLPLFEPGLIYLRVHCPPDREHVVRQLLETEGGRNFTTVGDAG